MIEVEMPDGTILEFPEGTAPEVMQQQAQQYMQGVAAPEAPAQPAPAGEPAPAPQERSLGETIFENVVGSGEVDTPGERLGATIKDMGKAAGAGIARGTAGLLGIPGSLQDLADAGARKIGLLNEDAPEVPSQLSAKAISGALSAATGGGTEFRGETLPGKFAGTAGEFLPATFGGSVGTMLKFGVLPGLASEAAGQLTEGTALEPYARGAAAIGAPFALAGLERVARRAITPLPGVDPERLNLAKVLDDFDIPITAGQRTGREGLRRIEGQTGRGQQIVDDQLEAFTSAALKTAGTDAKRATPEVLADTAKRIGAVFDDVVKGVDVVPDAQSVTAMSQAMQTYRNLTSKANQAPVVAEINKRLVSSFRTQNPVTASQLKSWRSDLSKLTTSADTATREAAQEALGVLDGVMANALTSAGKVADVARLNEARMQYRNFLAIQRAAARAGEDARVGIISPASLRGAVSSQGKAAFAQGRRGDIGTLAAAGEGVMAPLPTVREGGLRSISGLDTAASGGLGAALGAAAGGPSGAALGAVAGAAVPPMARGLLMQPSVQQYLANQLVGAGPAVADPRLLRSIGGLLAQ